MCGIVGFASNGYLNGGINKGKYGTIMSELLWVDSLRGIDSTGVVMVPKEAGIEIEMYKKALCGSDFVQLRQYRSLIVQDGWNAIIGHNRAATKGSVTSINAHPFHHMGPEGDIYLVHNGTVYNKHVLPLGDSFATDSETICNAIASIGLTKTIEKINGSYSLVWYNNKTLTLNFLRNEERPMELIWDKTGNHLWFCSEKSMLEFVLERNEIEMGQHMTLPEDQHVVIDLDDVRSIKSQTKVEGTISEWWNKYPARLPAPPPAEKEADVFMTRALSRTFRKEYKNKSVDFWAENVEVIEDPNIKNRQLKLVSGFTVDGNMKEVEAKCPMGYSNVEEGAKLRGSVQGWREWTDGKGTFDIILLCQNIRVVEDAPSQGDLKKLMEIKGFVTGPKNIAIPIHEFNELTKYGCAQCQCNILPEDHQIISWTQDNQPLCQNCTAEHLDAKKQVN